MIIGGAFVFLLIAIVLMVNGYVGLGLLASVPVVAYVFGVIAVLRNPPNVEEAQEQRRRHRRHQVDGDIRNHTFGRVMRRIEEDRKRFSPTTGQQQQAAPASSLAEEIHKLDTLRQRGVLTPAEFDEAKRRLIGRT